MIFLMRSSNWLLVCSAVFLLGCQSVPGLTGAASIRVQVDSYRGPLLQQWETQWVELFGILDETESTLDTLIQDAEISALRLGCDLRLPPSTSDDPEIGIRVPVPARPASSRRDQSYETCPLIGQVLRDLSSLRESAMAAQFAKVKPADDWTAGEPHELRLDFCDKYQFTRECPELNKANEKESGSARKVDRKALLIGVEDDKASKARLELLDRASRLAQRMRSTAHRWAQQNAAVFPEERRTRILIANVAAFGNEIGNQIASRADALVILETTSVEDFRDGIGLHGGLSRLLRDAGSTDFINLYQWNDATTRRAGHSQPDRIRQLERLVSDANWVPVNTVFASGQGDFTTALVKDELGNWNLKSFDNDPSEVLDAYKQVGLATLEAAARTAGRAFGADAISAGAAVAETAMSVANDLTLGGTNPQSPLDVKALHANTERELQELGRSRSERWTKLGTEIEAATKTAGDKKTAAEGAKDARDEAQKRRDEDAKSLEEKRQKLASLIGQSGEGTAQVETTSGETTSVVRSDASSEEAREDALILEKEIEARVLSLENEEKALQAAQRAWEEALAEQVGAEKAVEALENERDGFGRETQRMIATVLRLHTSLLNELEKAIVDAAPAG